MSDFLPDPPRWKERLDQAHLAEREAGRAIRLMATSEPLSATQLTRIAAHVRAARPRHRALWLTVTAALLLGGAAAASAAHLNILPGWLTRIVKLRPDETAPRKRASLGPSRKMPVTANAGVSETLDGNSQPAPLPPGPDPRAPEAVPAHPASAATMVVGQVFGGDPTSSASRKPARAPADQASGKPPASPESASSTRAGTRPGLREPAALEPAPALGVPLVSTPAPGSRVAWLEKPTPIPKTAPDVGGTQGAAKFLSEAIRALRVEHAPGTALFLLDQHATQLGQSAFAHEALLLRVEAMLALNRKGEVLRLLDGLALTDVAASRALLVTRGELRALAGRCADSLGDFDRVLARAKQADKQALFGRAVCRGKLGDRAGAQSDVERYRREFPDDPRLRELERQVGAAR